MYSYPFDAIVALCEKYGYLTQATSEQLEKLLLFTLRDIPKLQDIAVIVWICSNANIRYEDVLHCLMTYFHPAKDKQSDSYSL